MNLFLNDDNNIFIIPEIFESASLAKNVDFKFRGELTPLNKKKF